MCWMRQIKHFLKKLYVLSQYLGFSILGLNLSPASLNIFWIIYSEISWNLGKVARIILGQPKSSSGFFYYILQKDPKELFDQLNRIPISQKIQGLPFTTFKKIELKKKLNYSWFTMLVSFSDLVFVYILYIYIYIYIPSPYRLLQNIEYSSLCYILGPHFVCVCTYVHACIPPLCLSEPLRANSSHIAPQFSSMYSAYP